jgi:signal transduction histidine kinase
MNGRREYCVAASWSGSRRMPPVVRTVDRSRHDSRAVAECVIAAQEQERLRIGRELHDQTAQALAVILLALRATRQADTEGARLASLDTLEVRVGTALAEVRDLAYQLRPPVLERRGLEGALASVVGHFTTPGGLQVSFHSAQSDGGFAPAVEIAVFRMVQEALANVVKHAEASHASVLLSVNRRDVVAVVEDDGHGFDVCRADPGSIGLSVMRERVESLGGTLTIESAPGDTIIRAAIPVTTVERVAIRPSTRGAPSESAHL